MRDAASLVAPLSWLAVWNRQLGGKKDSSSSSEREEQYGNDDNDDDHDYDPLARAGVLYATICQTGPSSPSPAGPDTVRSDHDERNQRDLLARRVGLAQGLVDFTRSFASRPSKRHDPAEEAHLNSDTVDTSKEVRVVQSQNQRLVFLQPEPEFWIVAALDRFLALPITSKQPEEKKTSSQRKSQQSQQPRLHPSSFLPNSALEDLLKRAYVEYRLLNGTFANVLQNEGQDVLQKRVTTFFEAWKNQAKLIPLGIPRAPASLAHQFLQPPSEYSIVAVSHSGILDTHASSDANEKESQKRNVDSLKESDRLALAYHLATFLSSPKTKSSLTTPSTNTESKSVAKYKEKKVKKQPSLSSSTWKSLHLGSITNYLPSMPGMPNSSSRSLLPSVEPNSAQEAQKKPAMVSKPANPTSTLNKTSQATLKAEPGKRTVSGSAWIPTFGLFNTSASTSVSTARGQVKNGASTDSTVTNGPEPCIPELEPDEAVRVQKSEVGSQDERPEGEQLPISNSAATDTDIEAISEAILETISPQPNPTTPQEPESAQQPQLSPQKDDHATPRDTSVKSKFKAKWHSVCTIYVDNEYIARSCQLLSNDDIALALVPLADKATDHVESAEMDEHRKTMIDQYFTHLATLQAYPPPSAMSTIPTSRTFLSFGSPKCDDVVEQVIDDRASATNASPGQRYNLAINAKTDTDKLMKPNIRELFVRTYFSQWLVAERNETLGSANAKLTILPKSVGKEGSLLDADAEMRRLSSEP